MQTKQFIFALPLLPGKREAWLRFIQEMRGGRQGEYEAARRRLGIVRERFWLLETADTITAVIVIESTQPLASWPTDITQPFGRWLRRQLRELHGLPLNQERPSPELIAAWTDPNYQQTSIFSDKGVTQMSVEENRKIVNRAFEELLSQGNLAVADEVYAPDFTDNGEEGGPKHMKQIAAMYSAAFPDLSFHCDDQFGSGDKVVTRWRAQGTHRGEFMGVLPSGNEATMHGISIHTLRDGRIIAHWGQVSMLSFMQQIGAVPEPDAA